ncbi:MAG TPA: hypothetical protein VFQ61_17180 [Polyangiaceae bacterium]|nr:hypothetical protein [Polyangiaceae bacterium]
MTWVLHIEWIWRESLKATLWLTALGVGVTGLAFSPGVAVAQSSDIESARRSFREGNDLLERNEYAAALAKFERAHESWANPKIRLNIATTLRALGRAADAGNAYALYLEEVGADSGKREEVERVLDELRRSLARVQVAEYGVSRAELDGRKISNSTRGYFVEPGRHSLILTGRAGTSRREVELRAGELYLIEPEPNQPETPAATLPARAEMPTRQPASGLSDVNTPSKLFVLSRVDIEGSGRGAVAALGFGYELDPHVRANLGALIGTNQGGWLGIHVNPSVGLLRPMLGVSVPAFVVEGIHPGIAGELGLQLALDSRWYPFARASVVHFPGLATNYVSTLFVPAAGMEVRL